MGINAIYESLFGKNHIKDGDVISMAEHGRAGGVSTGQGYKYVADVELATKITTVGTITYIGMAKVGSSEASAVWQCKKIDTTTGIVITWADGDAQFDNVASDLTALTYS